MSDTAEIDALLAEDLRTLQKRLLLVAERVRWRRGRANTEVEDLFQEGVMGAFQTLRREALGDWAAFKALTDPQRQDKMVRIAAVAMDRRAKDSLRRAYRYPADCPIDDIPEVSDDSVRRARAAREDLDAIAAALDGSALQLYRLVLVHGREDMAWLADQLGRSVSQTYRILGEIKTIAEGVTGRSATGARRIQKPRSPVATAPIDRPAALRRA